MSLDHDDPVRVFLRRVIYLAVSLSILATALTAWFVLVAVVVAALL